jgi:class 3 adenylate cyclase/tetratricopeptide (TPR) repeat protein
VLWRVNIAMLAVFDALWRTIQEEFLSDDRNQHHPVALALRLRSSGQWPGSRALLSAEGNPMRSGTIPHGESAPHRDAVASHRATNMATTGGRSCTKCGALAASATASFCGECGSSIADGKQSPHRVVDAIIANRDRAGERKFVTVLFADVKGSTEIASGLDPEDWFLALERFHALATASIHRFDGVVTLYAGDGVMAVFGAPIAHESHAAQACWAALALNEQMQGIAGELTAAIGTTLGVRIGLNSGEVVVGRIGDKARTDYTAQGLPVHIAARMEQIAGVGDIFVAPNTAALAADRFEFAVVGEREVKGIAEPLLVRRLVGPVGSSSTGGLRPRATSSAFIGRTGELAVLGAVLADARAGRPGVVSVSGPAGFGKSRLISEFLRECRSLGCAVVSIVGDAIRIPGPMWTTAALARSLLNGEPDADEKAIDAALTEIESGLGVSSAHLRNLTMPNVSTAAVDPDVARRQIDVALRALLRLRTGTLAEPLVIAIDDIHTIDRASQLTVATLLANLSEERVLFVLTSRPTASVADLLPEDTVLVDLESLRLDETEQLVGEWFLDRDEASEVARVLHDRTGGNPFFVEETLRSLVESGQLVGTRGGRRLAGQLVDLAVPERVQTVIASRIDRLSDDQRDLLYAAAVVGVEFDHPTLVAINDVPATQVTRLLEALVAADMVRAIDGVRFAFRHRITQEVAYETQLRDQRRRCHAAVASALEKQSDADRPPVLVADHYERAGRFGDAATWYSRGATAAARTDPAESLRQWQKVRDLTVPTDAASITSALLCRAEILTQSPRCGMDPADVLLVIDEARGLATDQELRPLLAFVLLRGWYALSGAGLSAQARATSKEAVEIADATGIAMLSVGARVADVSNFNAAGSVADALAECDEAEALLVEAGLDTPESLLRAQLDFARGSLMVRTGRVEAAIPLLEAALARAEACDDPQWRVICRTGLANALIARRDPAEAQRIAAEASAIANEICGVGEQGLALQAIGFAALAAGDATASIVILEESLATSRAAPSLTTEERTLIGLADAYLLTGDVSRADTLAHEALAIAQDRGNNNFELMALLSVGRVLVAGGEFHRSEVDDITGRCDRLITANHMGLYRLGLDELVEAANSAGSNERDLRP